jgi:phosphoribosyl 1,2-cyclic phosphate phosphodiesterase
MLRAHVQHIDALVFTHGHKDHVAGLDDVRAYNYWQKNQLIYLSITKLKRYFEESFNMFLMA